MRKPIRRCLCWLALQIANPLDTATCEFNLCVISDDYDLAVIETLLIQVYPKELVLAKNGISKALQKLVKTKLPDSVVNFLSQDDEFWSSETTRDELHNAKYFPDEWPAAVACMRDTVAMSALGGLVFYLRSVCLIYSDEIVETGYQDFIKFELECLRSYSLGLWDTNSRWTDIGQLGNICGQC